MKEKIFVSVVLLIILLACFNRNSKAGFGDNNENINTAGWRSCYIEELGLRFKVPSAWSEGSLDGYRGALFTISKEFLGTVTKEFFILVSKDKLNPFALPLLRSSITDLEKYEIKSAQVVVDATDVLIKYCVPKEDINQSAAGVHVGKKDRVTLEVVELPKNNKYYYIAWYNIKPNAFKMEDTENDALFKKILVNLKIESEGLNFSTQEEKENKQIQKFKKAVTLGSHVYRNEEGGFEMNVLTDRLPLIRGCLKDSCHKASRSYWEDWEAIFYDYDFADFRSQAKGIPAIRITVKKCGPDDNLNSCFANTSSTCGGIPYDDVVGSYGVASLETSPANFLGFPAKRFKVSCLEGRVEEGIAFLRKDPLQPALYNPYLYTILFLTTPQIETSFSREVAESMLSTFKFINKAEIKLRASLKDEKALEGFLPDLMIKDIYYSGPAPYIYFTYCNNGKGASVEEFNIKLQTADGMFPGTFSVPMPGCCLTTGGITIGLIGAKEGDIKEVTAYIDWENKVKESNEENNTMEKTINFYPVENICEDTDGGKNYSEFGGVRVNRGSDISVLGDCCKKYKSGGPCVDESPYLFEAYCDGNTPAHILYECPQGCRRGACIQPQSKSPPSVPSPTFEIKPKAVQTKWNLER